MVIWSIGDMVYYLVHIGDVVYDLVHVDHEVYYLVHIILFNVVHYRVYLGDVDGSVEAILEAFSSYSSDQCQLAILQYGVGSISEQDVEMAANFGGTLQPFVFKLPIIYNLYFFVIIFSY